MSLTYGEICPNCRESGHPGHHWMEDPGCYVCRSPLEEAVAATQQRADESLIHYVMDLEALVKWFALPFRYQEQDGTWVQNEPIWTVYDERGTYLPEADRLQRTWTRVMDA